MNITGLQLIISIMISLLVICLIIWLSDTPELIQLSNTLLLSSVNWQIFGISILKLLPLANLIWLTPWLIVSALVEMNNYARTNNCYAAAKIYFH